MPESQRLLFRTCYSGETTAIYIGHATPGILRWPRDMRSGLIPHGHLQRLIRQMTELQVLDVSFHTPYGSRDGTVEKPIVPLAQLFGSASFPRHQSPSLGFFWLEHSELLSIPGDAPGNAGARLFSGDHTWRHSDGRQTGGRHLSSTYESRS